MAATTANPTPASHHCSTWLPMKNTAKLALIAACRIHIKRRLPADLFHSHVKKIVCPSTKNRKAGNPYRYASRPGTVELARCQHAHTPPSARLATRPL